ncbi:hypothetical protein HY640_04490 [Candidatus Woesearchaeota archaeon]|nr:hypothetical protein [Candidatus Woesearchaeota archaeon]
MEIIATGSPEFVLGFELAGIKTYNHTTPEEIKELAKQQIGIIVVEEKTMASLEPDQRKEFEDSIQPLFVTLSKEHSQETINKMIKKSIGIEL